MKTKNFLFRFCTLTVLLALLFSTALAASGTLDPTFGSGGMVVSDLGSTADYASSVLVQPDGKILTLGFTFINPDDPYEATPIVSRYTANGLLDATFGLNGMLFADTNRFYKSKIALQADGKLIVARTRNGHFTLTRYLSNGALDTTFGENGTAELVVSESYESLMDVIMQPDGKIIAVGDHTISGSNYTDFFIARFNTDGSMDTTFVANGIMILDRTNFPNNRYNYGKAVALQADGKIIISGNMMDNDGETQVSMIRLNSNGYPDTTYGTNGKGSVMTHLPGFRNSSGAIAIQSDGKLIVAGSMYDEETNTTQDTVMLRFNTNGSLDTTFGGTGIVISDFGGTEYGADIHLQNDGKIIMAGTSTVNDVSKTLIARYNSNGTLDTTFGTNGVSYGEDGTTGNGLDLQADGKILTAGSLNGDAMLARYEVPIVTKVATFKSAGAYDGWLLEYSEFSNTGGSMDSLATTFNLGDDIRDRQYRSILSFNTASLPDTAIITSAQLKIKRQGLVGTDPFTTHGALCLNIANRAFSNSLALQLSDFNAAYTAGSTTDAITVGTLGWYNANLSATNLNFVSKVGLTQFRLRFAKDDNDDLGADYLKFFSGNSLTENMPQLVINYFVP